METGKIHLPRVATVSIELIIVTMLKIHLR